MLLIFHQGNKVTLNQRGPEYKQAKVAIGRPYLQKKRQFQADKRLQ